MVEVNLDETIKKVASISNTLSTNFDVCTQDNLLTTTIDTKLREEDSIYHVKLDETFINKVKEAIKDNGVFMNILITDYEGPYDENNKEEGYDLCELHLAKGGLIKTIKVPYESDINHLEIYGVKFQEIEGDLKYYYGIMMPMAGPHSPPVFEEIPDTLEYGDIIDIINQYIIFD